MKPKICHFSAGDELPDDTVLYKYFSVESFLYLIAFRKLIFQPINKWPDAYEGSRHEFLRRARKVEGFANKSAASYLGCCWSLHQEDPRLYGNEDDCAKANAELVKHGSAAMWESYCKNGGVRVATRLDKLIAQLSRSLGPGQLYHGKVCYEAEESWAKTLDNSDVVCTLFVKRITFRHESEYRFIYIPSDPQPKIQTAQVDDFFNLIDEVLIGPATANHRWFARTLYNLAVGVSIRPGRPGTNHKDGKPYCRISQMYGQVSQLVGHGNMG